MKRPETREIASTADGRDITRGYVDSLPLLPPTDTVLAARGGGNYAIYEEVLRDDQVAATLAQRRLAVVSREWEVVPGGERRRDRAAADFLREQLDRIRFDAVTERMLYGVFWGYAVAECLWAREGERVVLDAVRVRNPRRFAFTPAGELTLLTTRSPTGEPLPARKFWAFSAGHWHDDDPYGLGLAHWLYWPVLFKRNGMKFWLIFLEKFGQPTGVGRYDKSATAEEQDRLLATVQAIQTDTGIILPKDMAIELLEAARSGTADYLALHRAMNEAIAKVVLGQTLTTQVGDSGSRALGDVHMAVRQDLVKADADLVCASFNATVARWLTEWNFPGAEPPKVWRRMEDEPDLKPQAERDEIISRIGFKPSLQYITETYGGEWVEAGAGAGGDRPPEPPGGGAELAEPEATGALGPDAADELADQLEREGEALLDDLIEPVRRLVMEADSLEAIRDGLLELYPEMDASDLGALMQRAFAAADLAGRAEVEEGAGDGP